MPRQRDADLIAAIGHRLAIIRRRKGFTQEQLAERVGLEPVSLSRVETGHRSASISTLSMIAQALGIPLADLVGVEQEVPAPELSPEESELLRYFKQLSTSQRNTVLRVAKELVPSEPRTQ